MKNIERYIALAFFLGIICKLYDDIVDNNLYDNFSISNETKPFFNEIMKGLFIGGYTIISIEYPIFMLTFTLINITAYLNCKNDFNPYDFSCFVSPIILIPFINWNEIKINKVDIISIIIFLLGFKLVESEQQPIEYSNKKMFTRLLSFVFFIGVITYKSSLYIENNILFLYFLVGYSFMSSISQYCLINGIWKSGDTIKYEDNVECNQAEMVVLSI
jgi:hypothetical protein